MMLTMLLLACSDDNPAAIDTAAVEDPLPAFVDDCSEGLNDDVDTLSGLIAADNHTESGVQLCEGDVPSHTWVSVAMFIDGSGSSATDGTDLDLWEIDPDAALPDALDLVEEEGESEDIIGYSASEQPYERLAWYNAGDSAVSHTLMIDGWDGSQASYDLLVRTSEYHEGLDCDDFFDDASEDGPCNRIMQFPQADTLAQGYVVEHEAHYSNLRREVAYLVRYAAEQTAQTFEGTNPLALMDMSQADGDTPGRMVDSLRHPEGTHVDGNDIDIAYYQTGEDNLGRAVCDNDGYYCTGDPTLMDAERTAFFMVKLMESPHLRVIGVDTAIAAEVNTAAEALEDEGLLESGQRARLASYMAYGDGWPFHHHHMHFSWSWEDGHTDAARSRPVDGCMGDVEVVSEKQAILRGR